MPSIWGGQGAGGGSREIETRAPSNPYREKPMIAALWISDRHRERDITHPRTLFAIVDCYQGNRRVYLKLLLKTELQEHPKIRTSRPETFSMATHSDETRNLLNGNTLR